MLLKIETFLGQALGVVVILALLIVIAEASQKTYGNFDNVEYVRNYDGDTVTFNIPYVHPIIGNAISIRVAGIDTPEIRGKCDRERFLAKLAKYYVEFVLEDAKNIKLLNIKRGKYFRIVADVVVDGENLAEHLIERKLAVPYFGKTKTKNWCD